MKKLFLFILIAVLVIAIAAWIFIHKRLTSVPVVAQNPDVSSPGKNTVIPQEQKQPEKTQEEKVKEEAAKATAGRGSGTQPPTSGGAPPPVNGSAPTKTVTTSTSTAIMKLPVSQPLIPGAKLAAQGRG